MTPSPHEWTADPKAHVKDLPSARKEELRRIRERGERAAGPLVLWTAGVLRPKGPVGLQEEE